MPISATIVRPLDRRFVRPDYEDYGFVLELFKLARVLVEQVIEGGWDDDHVQDLQASAMDMYSFLLPQSQAETVLVLDAKFPARGVVWDSEGNASIMPLQTLVNRATWLAIALEDYADHLEHNEEPGHAYVYAFTDAVRSFIAAGLRRGGRGG